MSKRSYLPMTTLGDSGLTTSRIGLGLAALGRPGYINLGHSTDLQGQIDRESMKTRAFEVFDAARTLGVTYFDAARSYGLAESFLAEWLTERSIEPGELTIGSKWGYTYTAGWQVVATEHEVKDYSLAKLNEQAATTIETIGPWVDLYQIHSVTLESGVLDDREVLSRLARLKSEQDWKIGLSLTGPNQSATLQKALKIEVDGVRLFDTVQATWNLLETSVGPALAEAHAAGMGVIVKEALANGRLTDRNDEPESRLARKIFRRVADRQGTTLDGLALAAVLARPWVDVVLSGASTVPQLESNLRSLNVQWNDEAEGLLRHFAEVPEEYWSTRAKLAWN